MLTIVDIDKEMAQLKPYETQRVAYHNNGSALPAEVYFAALLRMVGNHREAVPEGSQLVVVSHGPGMDLLLKAEAGGEVERLRTVQQLRVAGVRFLACRNTLRERDIDPADLDGVAVDDFVPSGVAHLSYLQAKGFAYLHV